MTVDLRVAPAGEVGLVLVSEILQETVAWLAATTHHGMWASEELTPAALTAAYDLADVHLARIGDEPVATIILMDRDPVFWPDDPEGEACFVHKLAVRRPWAGGAVSAALIDWAAGVARGRGARYLRLDCDAERPALRAVYERLGFRLVGRALAGPGPWDTCFYERALD